MSESSPFSGGPSDATGPPTAAMPAEWPEPVEFDTPPSGVPLTGSAPPVGMAPSISTPPPVGGEPPVGDGDRSATVADEVLPLPLAETAALVGEYRWIENALYRLLGQWVIDMPLAAVKVHLDGQSMRHAWHAELWADRLPVRDGVDPDALTVPSAPSSVLVAALSGSDLDAGLAVPAVPPNTEDPFGHPGALPRLAGLYRVALPRLVTSYERHLGAVAPVTDAPVARALRLVLNDEIEDWRAGERLVQSLVTRPHDVVAVHEFLQRLESTVVAAGAVAGLVTLPASVPGD